MKKGKIDYRDNYLMTCAVKDWDSQRTYILGVWFLNGDGDEKQMEMSARAEFGERCTIGPVRIWPWQMTLNEAMEAHRAGLSEKTTPARGGEGLCPDATG